MGAVGVNAGWLRWGATIPAAAYATLAALAAGPPLPMATLVVVFALVVSLGSLVTGSLGSWWFAPAAIALGGIAALALYAGTITPAPLAPLVLGVVLGTPALVLGLSGRLRNSSAWAPVAVTGALVADAVVLAVVRALPAARGSSAHDWATAVAGVFSAQWTSLQAFATGSSIPAPPLSYTGDAIFDATAVLALVGVLLSWLDPRARSPPAATPDGEADAYRPPSTVGPTPGLGRSGARSLVMAVGAVLVFELAAALSPSDALLGLAVTAPAVVTLVIGVTDRGRPSRAARAS